MLFIQHEIIIGIHIKADGKMLKSVEDPLPELIGQGVGLRFGVTFQNCEGKEKPVKYYGACRKTVS